MSSWARTVVRMLDDEPALPPGSGPTQTFTGPWFSTQLTLSLVIGLTSFFSFCFLRTRWEVVYMGRTKLKNFSPAPAHSPDVESSSHSRFFGWIIPTLRTSEFTVLQTVGLDAAVLLNFYRMAFLLFSLSALLAAVVLMPLNLFKHGSTDSDPDLPTNSTDFLFKHHHNTTFPGRAPNETVPATPSLYDLILDPQTSTTVHLIFTYLFTALCLTFLHQNFHRFVLSRQSFALHLIHSISARTVLVTNVPPHLRGDRALADYFEGCGWTVESVSVCREVEALNKVLERRTDALLQLETAWADWVGNPANVKGYDPGVYSGGTKIVGELTTSPREAPQPLIPDLEENTAEPRENGDSTPQNGQPHRGSTSMALGNAFADPEDVPESHHHIHTTRPRPTIRPHMFGNKVDAIEFWEKEFRVADEEVRMMRKTGRFEATHVAFVTFEDVKDAQTACQVVHYPHHSEVLTDPAPEPRDVNWSSVSMSRREYQIRNFLAMGFMIFLLLAWNIPVAQVASLLSYSEIKKVAPWLARIIDASPRLAAIVQNSLPSVTIIAFNGLLPFLLQWLSSQQGFQSRSGIEYSLMRKYHLFLLTSVLFVFLFVSSYWRIVQDLADAPMKIPQKLANGLQGSNARNFMVSYVMLQALGLMPLQLINLGPLLSLGFARGFFTKTPRDYGEANAPPMLNYGWVYPQSLLIFTITLVYSVVSPLILIFGAAYFGVAYLVYKYKLLFIYFKPYESNGEAWRITFARLLWALVIFQLFMTGLFSLRSSLYISSAMIPLILYTLWWSWSMFTDFGGLSRYLALSSICEVQRGEEADHVVGVRDEGEVTRSQSNLNHKRYAMNDETLYVAPSDKRTDYSQPPMSNFYYGVLNTGRRRYAHPALTGLLPQPWLPAKAKPRTFGDGAAERRGVVLSLRRKRGKSLQRSQSGSGRGSTDNLGIPDGWTTGNGLGEASRRSSGAKGTSGQMAGSTLSVSSNPWDEPASAPTTPGAKGLKKQISFGPDTGGMDLPDEEENVWGEEAEDSGEEHEGPLESPVTYFHHPERRRTISGTDGLLNGGGAPAPPEQRLPE